VDADEDDVDEEFVVDTPPPGSASRDPDSLEAAVEPESVLQGASDPTTPVLELALDVTTTPTAHGDAACPDLDEEQVEEETVVVLPPARGIRDEE
jgi:hypothetical protein